MTSGAEYPTRPICRATGWHRRSIDHEVTPAADGGRLGRFLDDVYNHKRIHSAPVSLTPAEFEPQRLKGQSAIVMAT
jgi:hypothetical protein